MDLICLDKREEIIAMSDVWGVEVEENSSEELPFENFNNMTSGNESIVLKREIRLENIQR